MLGEARDATYRADHAEVRQLGEALATQQRQARHRAGERDRAERAWRDAVEPLDLPLAIDEGGARLSLIEDLHAAADEVAALGARLRGIETDRTRFDADLAALWAMLGHSGVSTGAGS